MVMELHEPLSHRMTRAVVIAIYQALGLDFAGDSGTRGSVESLLAFLDGLGSLKYAYFLGGW